MSRGTASSLLRGARRTNKKRARIQRLVGKKPDEIDGNQRRTLRAALRWRDLYIDKFTGVIHEYTADNPFVGDVEGRQRFVTAA